jgi:hypothetical protein
VSIQSEARCLVWWSGILIGLFRCFWCFEVLLVADFVQGFYHCVTLLLRGTMWMIRKTASCSRVVTSN